MPDPGDGGTAGIPAMRWQAMSRIVDGALDLDRAERPAYVRSQCAGDERLREDVEAFLLACDTVDRSGHLLNEAGYKLIDPLADDVERDSTSARAALPSRLSAALGDRYEIGGVLGTGGNATVFRAREIGRSAEVAIKVLHPALSQAIGAERFLREVRITASLRHRNIIPVLDAGMADDLPYYVMPCVQGQTLKERLRREHQLPVPIAIAIARDVAAALEEAHAHGIVHRDVKPQNILLDGDVAFVADFGIARALEAAGTDRLTETGALIGTPAYMSPEQASGETVIDARSDVYSLACVMFEMLVGEPPFTGTRPSAVLAKHVLAPPPDVRIIRPSLPAALQDELSRALSKRAVDRHQGAMAFVDAVEMAASRGDRRASRPTFLYAAGVLALVGAVTAVVQLSGARRASPDTGGDTTSVLLLPIEGAVSSAAGAVDDDLLHQSVTRWTGITPVDRFMVADAIRQHGALRSANEVFSIARSLGAGRVVRGRISSQSGSRHVYLTLYDVRARAALHDATADLPVDPGGARATYARLADSLLLRGASPASRATGLSTRSTSRSLPALQLIGRARSALDEWNLTAADSALEAALLFDLSDPLVNLWLAQVRAWRGASVDTWITAATRAATLGGSLPARERDLARALAALGGKRFAEACRIYEGLRALNDRDFAAWYGLGQCRRMDKLVMRDVASPSGWRFRSSYDSSIVAFTTAFEILPSSLLSYEPGRFGRLRDLLMLSTTLTLGRSDSGATFYARLGVVRGRVTLVPYAWSDVSSNASSVPPGFVKAQRFQRERFREIAANWSAAFPRSSAAKHAVALALELQGDARAIDTLRLARRVSTDATERAHLAAAEVLLLVKFGVSERTELLRDARLLADSLLAAPRSPPRQDALVLTTLAALRGRCSDAEESSRSAAPQSEALKRIAPHLLSRVQALGVRSWMGCEVTPHAIAELALAVDRELRALPAAERARYAEMLFMRPALLAPVLDSSAIEWLGAASSNLLVQAALSYVRHDHRNARRALTSFAGAWSEASGPVTPDIAYPEARLFALLGDTSSAVLWLDRTLEQVGRFDPEVLGDDATLVSLIRAVALRAELASRGSEGTAGRWASVAQALWADADAGPRRTLNPRIPIEGPR